MSLKQISRVLFLFSLIIASIAMFQYIGSSKIDFVLIGLTSLIIGFVSFIFYESAIMKNKKLFVILIFMIVAFFSLFSYKKFSIAQDKALVSDLITVTKELKGNEFKFRSLIIEHKHKDVKDKNDAKGTNSQDSKKDNEKDVKDEFADEIKALNDKVNENINSLNNIIGENIRLLSAIHVKPISSNDKFRIKKSLIDCNSIKDEFSKNFDELKEANKKLNDKISKRESDIAKSKELASEVKDNTADSVVDSKNIKKNSKSKK